MIVFSDVEEKIRGLLDEYFGLVDRCMEQFRIDFARFALTGCGPESQMEGLTHALESKADDARKHIEMLLYGQALLPEYRGDILGFLETFDSIASAAKAVIEMLETERIEIPEFTRVPFMELAECNVEAYRLLRKRSDALLSRHAQVVSKLKSVDLKESESDRMERRLICDIFDSNMDKTDKLQLRDVVIGIGHISDRAEDVADRLGIITIKHHV